MKTNGLIKGLGTLFSKENRVKTIVVLGLLGIALILLSELVPVGGGSDTQAAGSVSVDEEEMKRQVEEKLAELIGSIAGVGECKIMVTYESTLQNVYESDTKTTSDSSSSEGGNKDKTTKEENVIILENKDGTREALLKTQLGPQIKGVVIACEGGEDVAVESRIIGVVTTAFQLPTSKVYVTVLENR